MDTNSVKDWSPHVKEHYEKVLEAELPEFNIQYGDTEYHMKKFPNKESRNKFMEHIEEA